MEETRAARVTAKDFFLWLGAMAALYWSAVSFILLAHQFINAWFPDAVLEPYGTGAASSIRFAVASLIVVFPLYVWLTRLLHQDIRTNPEKKTLWVRRWLIFLTLFVGGAAMAGDLVVTINVFLSGDLSIRFFLKAFIILAIVGAGFWYYLNELRGTWETKDGLSKAVAGITSAVVLVVVAGSFFIIGSAQSERLHRIDDQRINDLSLIQTQVLFRWQSTQTLPDMLEELEDPLSGVSIPQDPVTGEEYEYRPTGVLSFELCATFAKETRADVSTVRTPPPFPSNDSWWHGAGRTCFDRTIDPNRFPHLKSAI